MLALASASAMVMRLLLALLNSLSVSSLTVMLACAELITGASLTPRKLITAAWVGVMLVPSDTFKVKVGANSDP